MNRFLPYLIVSLIAHLLFLIFLKMPESKPRTVLNEEAPIWIDLKKGKYEIADIEPPAVEQRPDDSRFLGVYDSSVPEEEVAAEQGRGKKSEIRNQKSDIRHRTLDIKKQTLESLYQFDKGIFAAKLKERFQKTLEDGTPGEALPEDFYPNFKKGNHTYLNVLRFPEIQYFVRLKRVFKLTFDPLAGLRDAYLSNQITRGMIQTVLGVSVDSQGNLAEVFIFKSSGINRYDEEALRTIRASSPFSSPSSKLLDEEGLLRMSWTFTVYL